MKLSPFIKLTLFCCLLFFLCFPPGSEAAFPREKGFVNDFSSTLRPRLVGDMEKYLRELEKKTGAEIYVVVVNNLDGYSANEYGSLLYKEWLIGYRKQDQGVLILVSLANRRLRIVVGKGLEKEIPLTAREYLINERVLPLFAKEKYDLGLVVATATLAKVIAEAKGVTLRELVLKEAEKRSFMADPVGLSVLITSALVILVLILVPIYTRLPSQKKKKQKQAKTVC